jgi:hypothetical protein
LCFVICFFFLLSPARFVVGLKALNYARK